MTAVIRVKRYVCNVCETDYPHTPNGKDNADVCCACRQCGRRNELDGDICNVCRRENSWETATRSLSKALSFYRATALNQNRRDPELEQNLADHVNEGSPKNKCTHLFRTSTGTKALTWACSSCAKILTRMEHERLRRKEARESRASAKKNA